ncbi:MAG: hypothetical protein ACXV0U_05120, partial [Kineosporiaceae bacterium]
MQSCSLEVQRGQLQGSRVIVDHDDDRCVHAEACPLVVVLVEGVAPVVRLDAGTPVVRVDSHEVVCRHVVRAGSPDGDGEAE